jgi:hypothetical protein
MTERIPQPSFDVKLLYRDAMELLKGPEGTQTFFLMEKPPPNETFHPHTLLCFIPVIIGYHGEYQLIVDHVFGTLMKNDAVQPKSVIYQNVMRLILPNRIARLNIHDDPVQIKIREYARSALCFPSLVLAHGIFDSREQCYLLATVKGYSPRTALRMFTDETARLYARFQ